VFTLFWTLYSLYDIWVWFLFIIFTFFIQITLSYVQSIKNLIVIVKYRIKWFLTSLYFI
jgi:hypothetical protein